MTTLEIDENSHTSTSYIPTFYSGILSELNLETCSMSIALLVKESYQ
jgi:hypothetical protein